MYGDKGGVERYEKLNRLVRCEGIRRIWRKRIAEVSKRSGAEAWRRSEREVWKRGGEVYRKDVEEERRGVLWPTNDGSAEWISRSSVGYEEEIFLVGNMVIR